MANQHDPILDQRESVDMETIPEWLTPEILGIDIDSHILDANQELVMPEYMFSWRGVGFYPLGSIDSITGHKKNGKTMFETLLMVACLKDGQPIGPLRYELNNLKPNPKVLFIDTEQEQSYSLMVQRRVHYLMGWEFKVNNPRFQVLWLHSVLSAEERWKITTAAIWKCKPDFIVLDGCRDMVIDINKAEESTAFVRQTMKIATDMNTVLSQALHYNPGTEKMRGWLGTELGNRCAYIIELNKEKKDGFVKFIAKFTDVRGKDVDDLEFFVDDTSAKFGVPVLMDENAVMAALDKKVEEQYRKELRDTFSFIDANQYKYTTLREKIKKRHNMGSEKADQFIKDGVKYDILEQLEDNYYRLKIKKDGEDSKMPF